MSNTTFYSEYYKNKWLTDSELDDLLKLAKDIPNEKLRDEVILAINEKVSEAENDKEISEFINIEWLIKGHNIEGREYIDALVYMFNNDSYRKKIKEFGKIKENVKPHHITESISLRCPEFVKYKDKRQGQSYCNFMCGVMSINDIEPNCNDCWRISMKQIRHLFKVP